ncbi:MAG: arylsulfatase [Planctomycetaceae bacterium]|nr:arylsulfatase [Planctomycetaceae bacterium]
MPLGEQCVESAEPSEKPNIVLILADDLGYGQLGCFGDKLVKTPHLDRLATEGTRFTQFYAGCTVCAPSRSVLMTGLHTGHTRVRGNAGAANRSPQDLRDADVTVAEVLKQAGYATALIGKWGIGHEGSPGVPTRQGFDYFYGYLDQVHAHNPYPPFIVRGTERVPLRNRTVPGSGGPGEVFGGGVADPAVDYVPDLMTQEALAWIEQNKTRPFFLYWSLISPHANNEGTKLGRGQEVPELGAYAERDWPVADKGHAASITRLDADVGRLMERLRALGLDQNTLVIFSSDNGPHKEGGNDPQRFQPAGPWTGMKRDLTEGGIRVPTVARWPGHIRPGSTITTPLWFADILPTFAELAGATAPQPVDGRSFVPLLHGQSVESLQSRTLYWEFHERGFSQAVLMEGRWKAIRLRKRSAPVQLFDLETDPREMHDLADSQPQRVARAKQLFESEHTDSPEWPIKE